VYPPLAGECHAVVLGEIVAAVGDAVLCINGNRPSGISR
jgi:hypothetical protein